jgi:manganese/zinc/iron transport system ATP- binding protein
MDGFAPPPVWEQPLPTREPAAVEAAFSVSGLTVGYGGTPAIEDIAFAVPKGALAAIIGPNGAGKSTLLKSVLGLVEAEKGRVAMFGEPFAAVRRRVAYVPQRASVDWDFPARVIDVVTMALHPELGLFGRLNAGHRARIRSALERVGMETFAERQIGQLSGGQQQRVFLARALAQQADLYLLDEPLAGVDAATEMTILAVLRDLARDGSTIIAVHHDLASVEATFTHVALLNRRLISAGPLAEAFTDDAIARAYGGRTTR